VDERRWKVGRCEEGGREVEVEWGVQSMSGISM